jgi:hypothetical protein
VNGTYNCTAAIFLLKTGTGFFFLRLTYAFTEKSLEFRGEEAEVIQGYLQALRMTQFTHSGKWEKVYAKIPISRKSVQTSFLIQHTPCNLFPYLKFIIINTEHEKCEMMPG